MGVIINSTCLLWQKTCGKEGSCWLYDLVSYRYFFMGTMVGLKLLGVICYGTVVKVVKPYKVIITGLFVESSEDDLTMWKKKTRVMAMKIIMKKRQQLQIQRSK